MKFVTEVRDLPHREGLINHRQPIVMLGSCFSDNIGQQLRRRLFDVEINPFGTLYNPDSILEAVRRIVCRKYITEDDIFESDGVFHSWAHHSSFSARTAAELLEKANRRIDIAHEKLSNASTLIVTLGTAYAYRLLTDDRTVANYHKQPAAMFSRYLCRHSNIKLMRDTICHINRNIHVIATVSPIRHLAEGAHDNALSKAHLLTAIDADLHCNDTFGVRDATYFPAFEIMLDELRDYRFYAPDLGHPSQQAIDYIYEKFEQSFCDFDTIHRSEGILRLAARVNHRPI
ncbi:MAG: GSCFA domain-containing protein, partial [Prevotella sp.]|nr:GSCFA domain-containing protein [Prevotella sp.]